MLISEVGSPIARKEKSSPIYIYTYGNGGGCQKLPHWREYPGKRYVGLSDPNLPPLYFRCKTISKLVLAMVPSIRPRLVISRRFASSSTPSPSQNPQVQKAVEGAQRVYQQGTDTVKRLAGPLGERVGNALGGQPSSFVIHLSPSRNEILNQTTSSSIARFPFANGAFIKSQVAQESSCPERLSRTPDIQYESRHLLPPTSLPSRTTHTSARAWRVDERVL